MPKAILVEELQWYYLTHPLGNKDIHISSKGISLKVNVIALEFELAYFKGTVQHFCHYAIGTRLTLLGKDKAIVILPTLIE